MYSSPFKSLSFIAYLLIANCLVFKPKHHRVVNWGKGRHLDVHCSIHCTYIWILFGFSLVSWGLQYKRLRRVAIVYALSKRKHTVFLKSHCHQVVIFMNQCTVKKVEKISSFHAKLRFWAGKTSFSWQKYFSQAPQCILSMPRPKMCSLLWREKLPEILFIHCVFSSYPGWKNIPFCRTGEQGKLPAWIEKDSCFLSSIPQLTEQRI